MSAVAMCLRCSERVYVSQGDNPACPHCGSDLRVGLARALSMIALSVPDSTGGPLPN